MRKLYEFFKVLPFQKRIVARATIWENMVSDKFTTKIMSLLFVTN